MAFGGGKIGGGRIGGGRVRSSGFRSRSSGDGNRVASGTGAKRTRGGEGVRSQRGAEKPAESLLGKRSTGKPEGSPEGSKVASTGKGDSPCGPGGCGKGAQGGGEQVASNGAGKAGGEKSGGGFMESLMGAMGSLGGKAPAPEEVAQNDPPPSPEGESEQALASLFAGDRMNNYGPPGSGQQLNA